MKGYVKCHIDDMSRQIETGEFTVFTEKEFKEEHYELGNIWTVVEIKPIKMISVKYKLVSKALTK